MVHSIEHIYKPETISLIEGVHGASAHLIGRPNVGGQSMALTEPRDLAPYQLQLLRNLLLAPDPIVLPISVAFHARRFRFAWTTVPLT